MPDKSQLEKFTSDMQSVGDEVNIRRTRGQKMPTLKFGSQNNDATTNAKDSSQVNDDNSLNDLDSLDAFSDENPDLPDLSDFDTPIDTNDNAGNADDTNGANNISDSVDNKTNDSSDFDIPEIDDIDNIDNIGDTANAGAVNDEFKTNDPNDIINDKPNVANDTESVASQDQNNDTNSQDDKNINNESVKGDSTDEFELPKIDDETPDTSIDTTNSTSNDDDFELPDLDDLGDTDEKINDNNTKNDINDTSASDSPNQVDSIDNIGDIDGNATNNSDNSDNGADTNISNSPLNEPNLDNDAANNTSEESPATTDIKESEDATKNSTGDDNFDLDSIDTNDSKTTNNDGNDANNVNSDIDATADNKNDAPDEFSNLDTPSDKNNDGASDAIGTSDFDLPDFDDDVTNDNGNTSDKEESPVKTSANNTKPVANSSGGVDASNFDILNGEDIPDAGINIPKPIGDGEDYSSAEIPDLEDDTEDEDSDFDIPEQATPDTPENATSDLGDLDGGDEFSDPTAVSAHDSGFELEDKNKVKPEVGDFEIPGVNAPEIDKDAQEFTKKVRNMINSNKDLPPNTLSDADYDKFKKNFASYPLNVRLAIEDLFLKNEFTDDTEFDIVQKVVLGVNVRKIASELEKMLDVSLPIPKDFEKRSSEEYDAYKSSFEYQLRNRIIPGAIMCAGAAIICVLLFLAGKNFIYKPLKANSLYSKGYERIKESDYKASDDYFKEAITYNLQKGWFFKYARAYRDHKQYLRAEKMYDNILKIFNNDKVAGLEWADMESHDLSDYEKAEQIILRRVLDFHVNDKDALLALADNYLEWATEKEPKYFDTAYAQYINLFELYGKNETSRDLYAGRLLRYYVRTNNLQKVLETKARFMTKNKEKSLSGSDWTELGGFLLDKLYGPLEPNDEYLRDKIEDVKETLSRALRANDNNAVALYNMGRYYIQMHDDKKAAAFLDKAIENFSTAASMKKADTYRYIDSYKLSGDLYTEDKEYLKAEEAYTKGIALFNREATDSGLKGNENIGRLFYNMADINYFIAGNLDGALLNYQDAIKYGYDSPLARYKIGSMLYGKNDLQGALGAFMATHNAAPYDESVLLALGNTLALRGDNYLAQGYYEQLLSILNAQKEQAQLVTSSTPEGAAILDLYTKAHNNLGVTLYRIAKISGDSALNARAIINLQEGVRAYDSLTRNQKTMVRLAGSNLAEQNIKYITAPKSEFTPELYTDIARKMESDKGLTQ